MRKTILQEQQSCSAQKTARRNTKYSRSETILKITLLAKDIAFPKWSVWLKIKNAKNMRKNILQEHQSCSVQKTVRKNAKYSRNETLSKIGHLAKTISPAKWSGWTKNEKCQKDAKNHPTRTVELFCAKDGAKKRQIFEK